MQMRFRAALALTFLSSLSQSATADEAVALELSSRFLTDSSQVEFTLVGAPTHAQAWLLSVDEPRELVAIRTRLESGVAAGPLSGDHDLKPIQLSGEGSWSRATPEQGLRTWYQAVVLDVAGDFHFSDLTRGARMQSGSFLGGSPPQDGFVVVTEIMKDPAFVSDTLGEWFEIYNAGPHRINVEGWVISDDGSNAHLIFNDGAGVWMLPRRRLVLGRNEDTTTNGGVAIDYEYSGFTLGNSADQIMLNGPSGRLFDRVAYDNGIVWPDAAGQSISLAPGAEDRYLNDAGSNWCSSTTLVALNSTDTGTPGAPNDVCP